MTIWRMLRPNGRLANPQSPGSASAQAAGDKARTGRCPAWLTGMVLFGSFAAFNEMPTNAQASLPESNSWTASPSRLSSTLATSAATDDAALPSISARVTGQGAGANNKENDTELLKGSERADAALGNPLWRMPLRQFSVTRDRPIFSSSRRPPPPAPAYVAPVAVRQPARPPEPEHPTIALAGTIIGTDGFRVAVFRETSSQKVLRLRVGESYRGWVVRLISPREVRLVKNGEQALLELPLPAGAAPHVRSSQDIMLDRVWQVGAD